MLYHVCNIPFYVDYTELNSIQYMYMKTQTKPIPCISDCLNVYHAVIQQSVLSLGDSIWYPGASCCYLSGQRFSAFDRDQDSSSDLHCAQIHHGGWWYNACSFAQLNDIYFATGGHMSKMWQGINWYHWKGKYYSHKRTEMKIRPH